MNFKIMICTLSHLKITSIFKITVTQVLIKLKGINYDNKNKNNRIFFVFHEYYISDLFAIIQTFLISFDTTKPPPPMFIQYIHIIKVKIFHLIYY